MGRLTGVEPATTRITTEGSTTELQSPYTSPWCGWRDLNPHALRAPEPKSGASTNFATAA